MDTMGPSLPYLFLCRLLPYVVEVGPSWLDHDEHLAELSQACPLVFGSGNLEASLGRLCHKSCEAETRFR